MFYKKKYISLSILYTKKKKTLIKISKIFCLHSSLPLFFNVNRSIDLTDYYELNDQFILVNGIEI
jgi:hypothetical protein